MLPPHLYAGTAISRGSNFSLRALVTPLKLLALNARINLRSSQMTATHIASCWTAASSPGRDARGFSRTTSWGRRSSYPVSRGCVSRASLGGVPLEPPAPGDERLPIMQVNRGSLALSPQVIFPDPAASVALSTSHFTVLYSLSNEVLIPTNRDLCSQMSAPHFLNRGRVRS